MSEYQAVYDAVRSRIPSVDIGEIVRQVAWSHFDVSIARDQLVKAAHIAIDDVRTAMTAPSVVYKPKLYRDPGGISSRWSACYSGSVYGYGATPEEAMASFNLAWKGQANALDASAVPRG